MIQHAAPPNDTDGIPSPKGKARAVLAMITLLAMAGTAGLGAWQLQRAAFKNTLASEVASRSKLPAIESFAAWATPSKGLGASPPGAASAAPGTTATDSMQAMSTQALVHRTASLRGQWLHQHTVFLDNRFMGGRPGFIVATPLQIASSNQAVWVQRGWVARDPQERTRLPSLVATEELVTVRGRVVAEVSRVYALGAVAQPSAPGAARDSRIWQNLPAVDFSPPTQLLPVAVLQTASSEAQNAPDGLQRDWPALDSGVAKHYGYAFQWFALCGLIMVLYAWFQFIAPRRRKH